MRSLIWSLLGQCSLATPLTVETVSSRKNNASSLIYMWTPTYRIYPEMSTKDVHIAEAAAQAGFDCRDCANLKWFLDAVHQATAPVSYLDRWTGPGAFKSDIYPSRRAADCKDADAPTSVQAFVTSSDDLLRKIKNLTHPQATQRPPFTAGTGFNRQTLGPRSTNKGTANAVADQTPSTNKRAKANAPASPPVAGSYQRNVIDLTQEGPAVTYKPTRVRRVNRKHFRVFNRQHRHISREQNIQRETTGIMAKVASKLRVSHHTLQIDRETLRNRWEVDENLQLQHVTDQPAELNLHFSRAEEAIDEALYVIEQKLLK